MDYPKATRLDLVETLHGVQVADPYRWLEDPESRETRAWVDAQNALMRSALDGAARDGLVRRLTACYDYPRTTSLLRRGGREFFTHNPGLLNQPILYVRAKTLTHTETRVGQGEAGVRQGEAGLGQREAGVGQGEAGVRQGEAGVGQREAGVGQREAGVGQREARVGQGFSPDLEPRVLIDPNTLTADGTTALTAYFPSDDGRLVAYALSSHGSDRQELRVREVASGSELADRVQWVKFASLAWTKDASAFYYLRFPQPGTVAHEDEQYYGRIYLHRLGDPQSADVLVFEKADEKEVVPLVAVSHGGRWVVITAQRGASDDSELYVAPESSLTSQSTSCELEAGSRKLAAGSWQPLFTGFRAAYHFIEEVNGELLFRTTDNAPMGRIVAVDPERPERGMREVVAESGDRLSGAAIAGDTLVASYLHDASDRLRVFDLSGSPRGDLPLPGIGSIIALDATPDDDEVRVIYTSFTDPPRAYVFRDDRTSGLKAGGSISAHSRTFQTRQVWYQSKDGTRVSMFLVHRADLPADGRRRVLLSGYGGFNISRTPAFDPGNIPFLEDGGIFALANVRGGGEYGETWHRAGMLDRKQNVFDDFIAAAEYLIKEGYTTPDRLAIEGGSNGGLLVAAVMLQRPDLFGAVICRVPVADMLRYHLFTIGRFWIPEYGSADDPAQFQYLLKYSPYHNIVPGARYPPALVMTADTDDRVAPGMAKKFAARLQSEAAGGPFLIRVETKAGHGVGKPVTKLIDEDADILAFVDKYLGSSLQPTRGARRPDP